MGQLSYRNEAKLIFPIKFCQSFSKIKCKEKNFLFLRNVDRTSTAKRASSYLLGRIPLRKKAFFSKWEDIYLRSPMDQCDQRKVPHLKSTH